MGDSIFSIRYGILKVDEKVNITPAGTPDYFNIKAYMACKCYIVSETKKYRPDGSVKEQYEVVYLYKKNGDTFMRVNPIFEGEECINKEKVNDLFTDYESASAEAVRLNDASFKEFATSVPYDSNYGLKVKTGKINFDRIRELYKEKELELEDNTKEISGNVKKIGTL